jgi:hypothetical protein
MWTFDSNYNKWILNNDKLTISDFDFTVQELSAVRFYAKCLSGATYLPVNDLNDIYDILGNYQQRNWYVGILGSQYTNSLIPSKNPSSIDADTSSDFYDKYLPEYGLTLKNLFTPTRLIKDSLNNYIYVDVATTDYINDFGLFNTGTINLNIDGVRLKEGHRVLVKDQINIETLPNTIDPDTYFKGNYTILNNFGTTIEYRYFSSQNGIYLYTNNVLVKQADIEEYKNAKRFSVSVKQGTTNTGKQFHLSRLLNGYYPVSSNVDEPVEFIEKHNWILRNKVDYNNLFEINYYDVVKFATQSYTIDAITYSIPERTISVGEFGVILNHQEGVSNLITNKYKVDLRSISSTTTHYWVCGDNGVLLKIRKHDFNIEKVKVDCLCPRGVITSSLKSISFYDDLRGVVVGDLNVIAVTQNGGHTWDRIKISDFDPYNYNKVIYYSPSAFFIGGNTGVFIEMKQDISGWTAYKRRVTRLIDDEDEYVLVDNINDLLYTKVSNWGLSYSYSTQSTATDKELLFIVSDDSKIIAHDVNNSIPGFDFVYLELPKDYDDIMNISRKGTSSNFYFTGLDVDSGDSGIFSFDLTDFSYIGVGNSYSNTIPKNFWGPGTTFESSYYPNEIFDYNGEDMIICGNTSLLRSSTYSTSLNFNILDTTFEDRLKAKLLFLDYDAASKLNFFDDFGQYRLPNSLTFSSASFSSNSYLEFKNITYGATYPSYATHSEINWFNYWSDREKTFEYYSALGTIALDESTEILMSSTFSYSATQSKLTITNLSASASYISYLAPTILEDAHSRFNGAGMTAISSPLTSHDLYIYDYLMIAKVSLSYPVVLSDVMRFESNIVDGNFIVNKVEFPANDPTNKYIYMFSEFNGNITKDLQSTTYSITLTNLNKYSTVSELEERFNNHPISNGYSFTYDSTSSVVEINPLFNYLTSYYNLATNVITTGDYHTMSYTSGFLNFGYKPTYNLLDYLERLNDNGDPNPKFYGDKEYYAMPDYRGIPLQGIGDFLTSNAYLDYNGITYSTVTEQGGNKILFGIDLVLEWESILINTFVDVRLYSSSSYTTYTETKRLLVMNKYFDIDNNAYVIEFQKNLKYSLQSPQYFIDIISRRKLSQISEDLQELNNIQRPKLREKEINSINTGVYSSYDPELNFKIPTDSYAKVLLSDIDTIEELSAIIYIDDKNELSMNITRLEKEMNIPISNTGNYSGNLFIFCSEKHGLKTGDGVNLEFNGGDGSSQYLNQDYFGFHPVVVVNEYNFYLNYPYGNYTLVGSDSGFVRYVKKDPFLNYEPVDLIDYGVDKKGKQSIEISIDNLALNGDKFRLIDVDFTKYRFRLIDGLNIETLSTRYPWILEAEISDATIGEMDGDLVWYKGLWECGRWFSGRWVSGTWLSGDWYDGTWDSKLIKDNKLSVEIDEKSSSLLQSVWYDGRWFGGNWNNGTWNKGRWYDGNWNNGIWYRGIWNDGTWNDGSFCGGIWVLGTWNNGIFNTDVEPAYWLDGKWYGGDFENGMWYNGLFDERNDVSRFGINAYSSRTATWHGGKWLGGSFYSRLNLDDNGIPDVSDIHKYSIWYTGTWFKGDFYGGVAYNMDWKSGTWHGGILEDIQVIGLTGSIINSENYFTVNGIFKFNIGDEITIIDNQVGGVYSTAYGSNESPDVYKVLYTVEDSVNKWTDVYVDRTITYSITPPVDTKLRVVSRFREANWKTGIWTNGIFEKGLWEGGIWYNGVFEATWM